MKALCVGIFAVIALMTTSCGDGGSGPSTPLYYDYKWASGQRSERNLFGWYRSSGHNSSERDYHTSLRHYSFAMSLRLL
jgi:hypothetical protein